MTFPEQHQPVVSTPEQLLARGDMPQIPYAKTSRVPEGFEPLELDLVSYLRDRVEGDITSRTITMHAGRVNWVVDDPDVPREAKDRTALFSVALTEGGDAVFWVWCHQAPGSPIVVSDFLTEADARHAYTEATTDE